jgi:hypothetical protein
VPREYEQFGPRAGEAPADIIFGPAPVCSRRGQEAQRVSGGPAAFERPFEANPVAEPTYLIIGEEDVCCTVMR